MKKQNKPNQNNNNNNKQNKTKQKQKQKNIYNKQEFIISMYIQP